MEPWEVFIRTLAEAWAEEDIRSGRYGEIQKKLEGASADLGEVRNERQSESNGNKTSDVC